MPLQISAFFSRVLNKHINRRNITIDLLMCIHFLDWTAQFSLAFPHASIGSENLNIAHLSDSNFEVGISVASPSPEFLMLCN